MKVVKIVNKDKKFTSKKNGKEYVSVNYYLVLDNNQYVAIRPAFGKGFAQLDAVAMVVVNGKDKGE